LIIRTLTLGLEFKRSHYIASVVILLAVGISMLDFTLDNYKSNNANDYFSYALMFMCAAVIDIISHSIKENTVRSFPID
jgi:hypothetical protein